MTTDSTLKVLAFLTMVLFIGILVLKVPRWDLGIVVGLSVLAAAWDFFAPPSKR